MNDDLARSPSAITRRAALAGFGVGALGLAFATRGKEAIAQRTEPLQEELGVVYGAVDGAELILDVARPPDRPEPRPAVILIHGGTLIGGTRAELSGAAQGLAQAGYATFNVDYRLFSQTEGTNLWPAQLDDVQRAVRWIRANAPTYGIDPERIGSLGWSSGGQLAAFLGVRDTHDNSDPALAGFSSRVSCVVDLAGDVDLTIPFPSSYDNLVTAQILGGSFEAPPDQAAIRDFSPIAFVDETSAPFLIMHGGYDTDVPVEQPRRMVEALQTAGVEVTYAWFPDYDHLSWGQWASEAPETLAFFGRHLTPDR